MVKFKTYIIFGPNGIGKGTNSAAIGALPNYLHFATGKMFRALANKVEAGTASEMECEIAKTIRSGGLVDDATTVKLSR